MKRYLCILALLILAAQTAAFAGQPLLIYFQNRSGGLRLVEPGEVIVSGTSLRFGMNVKIGTTIVTEKGDSAEIQLSNGSIIKVHENTNFTIAAIQGENGATKSAFELQVGKFRAVAGKVAGDEEYEFRTRTAVCGVRGTDTGMESLIDPATRGFLPPKVFVFDGSVDVTKLDELGRAIGNLILKTGEWADVGAAVFEALRMDPAMIESFRRGLDFEKLDPRKVPGHTVTVTSVDTTLDTGTDDGGQQGQEEPEWVKAVRELIGMEIGTVTIGNVTYGKVVFSPEFKFDDFRLYLYLPVIYTSDMFNPADWYRPDGNDEWSFGTDAAFGDDWAARIGDAVYDLVLKIKGMEIGQLRDPFYLKLGNLKTFTIGHGMIVRNYANDSDFPSVRKIGFQMGLDTGPFGMEVISDDLGTALRLDPDILGTRLYFRPAFPFTLAIGFSFIADFNPAGDVANMGDPLFLNAGLDLDFPIVESDFLSMILYADFALMLPYFRETVGTIPPGFAFDAIVHGAGADKSFRNFGAALGVMGNVSLFEWRLEARYSTGMFRPAIMNAVYDRSRFDYVNEVINYLQNPGAAENQTSTLGIYGEGVFNIEKVFSITIGYLCPLDFTAAGIAYGENDFFQIKVSLEPKVIPVVGIYGSLSYERNKFIPSFAGGFPELFDENTVVRATLGYPVAEGLDILIHYTTTQTRDHITGAPTLTHAFTFETVIDF